MIPETKPRNHIDIPQNLTITTLADLTAHHGYMHLLYSVVINREDTVGPLYHRLTLNTR